MERKVEDKIVTAAIIISFITYMFWSDLKEFIPNIFYLGNSIFALLISIAIYIRDRGSFARFFLLSICLSNFFDEILFNPVITSWNELSLIVVLPLCWLLKEKDEDF